MSTAKQKQHDGCCCGDKNQGVSALSGLHFSYYRLQAEITLPH